MAVTMYFSYIGGQSEKNLLFHNCALCSCTNKFHNCVLCSCTNQMKKNVENCTRDNMTDDTMIHRKNFRLRTAVDIILRKHNLTQL